MLSTKAPMGLLRGRNKWHLAQCTVSPVVFVYFKMHVKNGSKDLKRYPQISRRVRDTLARLPSRP